MAMARGKNVAEVGKRCMSTAKSGWWRNVPVAPRDPILGVTEAFLNDSDPRKVNVGGGRTGTTGRKRIVEQLWLEFFVDPSQWWDSRAEKANPRYPDFKHKETQESLWIGGKWLPPWVEAKLAAVAPGTLKVDVFTWNRRLARYAKVGQYEKTMSLYCQMQQEGMKPDKFTFVPVLNACSGLRDLEKGRCIHAEIININFESDVFVGNSLIDMYAKCGSIEDACRAFSKMPKRDLVSWNAMIMGYVKCGQGQKALQLYCEMQSEGFKPDSVTFVGLLNACTSVLALEEGRRMHNEIIARGCVCDVFVASSLVDMYAKCGSIEEAWRVFQKMPTRNVVTWSAMILGYVKCGEGQMALELFREMRREKVEPNTVTFVGVMNACASVMALEEGRNVHKVIVQRGYESDVFVHNALIDMYVKCGSIEDAKMVFSKIPTRHVAAWSSMILGYVRFSQGPEALSLYQQMRLQRVEPDPVTFVGVLNACASVAALEDGRDVHKQIVESGCDLDVFLATSLVDMYAKCGSMDDAWSVFNKMPKHSVEASNAIIQGCVKFGTVDDAERVFKKMSTRNVVTWSAMILGYVKCGQGQVALALFQQMQRDGVEPNKVTFVGVLNACASVVALEEGKNIHQQIIQSGFESDTFVHSGLIDMYAKCGSIEDAERVFSKIPTSNKVAWTAMLAGYAVHGHAKKAIGIFEQMCQEGVEVDKITFLSLLSACGHGGLVDEGLHFLESMHAVYNIFPTVDHYACVADLLGRAGCLHEAEDLIKKMSCELSFVYRSLLSACRNHGNVEMGESVGERVLELDPGNASGYVLLSSIYADARQWDSSANIRRERLERGVQKAPDHTWIEVNKVVHSFMVDDRKHPKILEILSELKRLMVQVKEEGYKPYTRFVFDNIKKINENEVHLSHHSEKLAIAFGLLSTPPGTPIRIFKFSCVCGDCHTATKFIAKVVGRTIIVRDANRFHHFQDGICSCGDYW